MIECRQGTILRELFSRPGISGFVVRLGEKEEKAIAYTAFTGDLSPGERVLLNTTAVSLDLGSGGYHYIIAPLDRRDYPPLTGGGHIMKLRYTPLQLKVLSVEEEESPFHHIMQQAESLEQVPVLVGTLHSMLAPLALFLVRQGFRVAYVMTDGAALPLAFSRTVQQLRQDKILVGTVTAGHAFGGDLESVNVYSGLLAARHVLGADVVIVTMGPGIVGTGTKWGFSGIEQGDILNAVSTLKGRGIGVPRISFADSRSRHRGISHHTLTALGEVARGRSLVPIPLLDEKKLGHILGQIRQSSMPARHHITLLDGRAILDILQSTGYTFTTMGRGWQEDQDFYLALGAAARAAEALLKGELPPPVALA